MRWQAFKQNKAAYSSRQLGLHAVLPYRRALNAFMKTTVTHIKKAKAKYIKQKSHK